MNLFITNFKFNVKVKNLLYQDFGVFDTFLALTDHLSSLFLTSEGNCSNFLNIIVT